jgi:hypothetical protein
MLKPSVIQSLPALAGPVLTAYLDTDQAKQINRGLKPGYLIRLKSHAKSIGQTVSPDEQELFRKQLQRTESYLQSRPPRCRGVVIFAGSDSWKFVPLQVEVEDEIHWGTPALAQLLWLLDEHKRYWIVVPGRKRVQFFLYWLGEVRELGEKEFRLEPSKKKEMGPVSRPAGVRLSRGTNRDVFEHHLDAEYAHYDKQIAERIERWFAAEQLESVFLVGLAEMLKAIRKEIAPTFFEKIVLIEEDLGWVSRSELLERIEPVIISHKRKCEMAAVEAMLGDSRNVVMGVDEILVQLQQGKTRSVVVVKGLDESLQQCLNCSWADRTSDPACPACGGKRKNVALRDVLPELVRRHKASLEIVSGEGAGKLQESGGMGAWLREFEKKEYPASA